jgi:two-component system phosphate regulon sensor histidine kinase PhoR
MFFKKNKKQLQELSQRLESASKKIAELERQNSAAQSILGSMVEGVIAVDRDCRIISLNSAAEEIFGIKKGQAEGKFFLEAVRNNEISEILNEAIKRAALVSREISLVWPVQKVFQVNASPVAVQGRTSGCLAVIHDVTEIRRLERMRSDFVANVSHELKTPLTSIKGFVETLLSGALDDKENSAQFLKVIQKHTDRLDSLINDLLDLSQLESGEAKLRTSALDLKDLADNVLAGFRSQIKKKGISAENNIPSGMSASLDKAKIEQVFTNLIDNAIKFNKDAGCIKIYSEDLAGAIKVIIEDSGIGIPPKDIPRIFERFYRVDKARSREMGGTGLGLSIVRHIVELHGGSVGVESTEGLGSKFWLILPK